MSAGGSRRILVLGAGLVAAPLLRWLLARDAYRVTVGTKQIGDAAQSLLDEYPATEVVDVEMDDPLSIAPLIDRHDVVVSLLPVGYHVPVAILCVEHRTPLVTTSYVGPEMAALDGPARRAGITLLNECGLDPGLDHMIAMRLIDRARADGGRVTAFRSFCGGLPAPDSDTNPWHYKVSWSPRGVCLAARSNAHYLDRGRPVDVAARELFRDIREVTIDGVGRFEAYPNRDAVAYRARYGLDEAHTIFRGTLRWPGHGRAWDALARLSMFSLDPFPAWVRTRADVVRERLGVSEGDPRALVARALGLPPDDDPIERMAWIGLFDDEPVPAGAATPLDVLAALIGERLRYAPGERDMVVLRTEIAVQGAGDEAESVRTTDLVAYGDPEGDSATARTVGIPAAVATALIAGGAFRRTGVQVPVVPDLYEPILAALEEEGITFRDGGG